MPILIGKQTTICTYITLYSYTVHCTIRTRAHSVRRQQGERTSEESEIVTHKHATEVVKKRCFNHLAKRVDSRAILLLISTSVWALTIWINKQTNINILNKTNKLNK